MRENRGMKIAVAAMLACALTAASAAAQPESLAISSSTSPPPPDYSREALLRFVSNIVEPPPPPESRVQYHLGYVEFKALNMRWRIAYLPFLAPLAGSYRRTNSTIPDAFSLTGTEITQTARTWRDQRTMTREMRRILRTERERAKVKAAPE
jgi:hypothetical protein